MLPLKEQDMDMTPDQRQAGKVEKKKVSKGGVTKGARARVEPSDALTSDEIAGEIAAVKVKKGHRVKRSYERLGEGQVEEERRTASAALGDSSRSECDDIAGADGRRLANHLYLCWTRGPCVGVGGVDPLPYLGIA